MWKAPDPGAFSQRASVDKDPGATLWNMKVKLDVVAATGLDQSPRLRLIFARRGEWADCLQFTLQKILRLEPSDPNGAMPNCYVRGGRPSRELVEPP